MVLPFGSSHKRIHLLNGYTVLLPAAKKEIHQQNQYQTSLSEARSTTANEEVPIAPVTPVSIAALSPLVANFLAATSHTQALTLPPDLPASVIQVDAGVTSTKAGDTADTSTSMVANILTISGGATGGAGTVGGCGSGGDDGGNGGGSNPRSHIAHVAIGVPVIPSPYIDFIIVNGDDRYMIRCERRKILENSAELARIIMAGPNSGRRGDMHYQIANVDKHDFELLVRFLETRFIKYRDHLHILRILEMADLFKCPDLIVHSIRELDLHMSSDTVIDIFRALWFYQGLEMTIDHQMIEAVVMDYDVAATSRNKNTQRSNNANIWNNVEHQQNEQNQQLQEQQQRQQNERQRLRKRQRNQEQQVANASAPALSHECVDENVHSFDLVNNRKPFSAEDYGVSLLHNALQLIDMHAELVLTKSQISELRFEELETIAKRDRLQLRSEMTLFGCLADWSIAECRRRNLDITAENRRRVLGPLCYAPRYALMSYAEFCRACTRVELLDTTEIIFITETIQGKEIKDLSAEQYQLLRRFQTPRSEFARMPIHLSDRSNHKNYPRRMRRAAKYDNDDEDNCWENVGLNCLSVLACIFD